MLDARYPGTEGLAQEIARFLDEMIAMGGVVRVEEITASTNP